MNEESPLVLSLTSAQKRTHAAIDGSTSDNEDESTGGLPALDLATNQNAVSTLQRYTEKKRLRMDQASEVTLLLKDPPAFRYAKLLANIFHVSNQLSAIVTAQAPFEVNSHLDPITLPPFFFPQKLAPTKAAFPPTFSLICSKKHRFDLPAGIENNPADYGKVVSASQDAFTQFRAKCKKAFTVIEKVET
ncbi:hypothetical protein B0H14DRAFT_3687891 [Mycena olivaceomarginata]|nr:hypothetical protein B0H14DRAFT_3687891 [Mycena olivaceomarginata]